MQHIVTSKRSAAIVHREQYCGQGAWTPDQLELTTNTSKFCGGASCKKGAAKLWQALYRFLTDFQKKSPLEREHLLLLISFQFLIPVK